jgi:lipopolysaccharide transport system permease protein
MTASSTVTKLPFRIRTSSNLRKLTASHSAAYLLTHGRLLLRVTRNELGARYAGSLLGLGWTVLTPLLLLGIYAVVYLVIFPFQPPGLSSSEYTLYIFAGLVPFLTAADALSSGVGSIVANRAVLSNVVFPIDLVPPKAVLGAQVTMTVGMGIMLIGTASTGTLSWTALLVPLLWLMNVLALVGVLWVLSLLNIVFRDLQNLITAVLLMLLLASPIVYMPEMVPTTLKWLVWLNPLAYFIIVYQKLWLLGELPDPFEAGVIVGLSAGGVLVGGWFFARAKRVLIDYV